MVAFAVFFATLFNATACTSPKSLWQEDKQQLMANLQSTKTQLDELKKNMHEQNLVMKQSIQQSQTQIIDLKNKLQVNEQQHTAFESRLQDMKTAFIQSQKRTEKKLHTTSKPQHPIQKKKAFPQISPIQSPTQQHVQDEKTLYTAAYLALKSNSYRKAVQKFNELLTLYAKGEYAHQAYYWLGESYNASENPMQALQSFQHVVKYYPLSTKHAASMLKSAQLYLKIDQISKGTKTLQQLIQQHPQSTESIQAQIILKTLHSTKSEF